MRLIQNNVDGDSLLKAAGGTDRKAFESYLEATRQTINSELSKLLTKYGHFRLHEEMQYALLSAGKRLRATMAILSTQAVGGQAREATNLALAIELMHTATLVHDDILDQDTMRRSAPAVHAKWSVNDAILVGDALVSLAIGLSARYGPRILEIFSETGVLLCEGEFMDANVSSEVISEEEYLEKISKKSACLFKAAAQCGAIAGDGTTPEIDALAQFGQDFGMAYQMKDDLLDTVSFENGTPPDLKQRRATLPIIHLFESASHQEREKLQSYLKYTVTGKKQAVRSPLVQIFEHLEDSGSLEYCWEKVNERVDKSIGDAGQLDDSVYRFYLVQMAESLRPDTVSRFAKK